MEIEAKLGDSREIRTLAISPRQQHHVTIKVHHLSISCKTQNKGR